MEKIYLTTSDEIKISGLFWDAKGLVSVLLLHMMPATKESWTDLANRLVHRGVNVLAIDFRGHGESGGGDYQEFSDDDHQEYLIDAKAGAEFLKEKYPKAEIGLIGASIGANIALQLMSDDPNYLIGVALSSGLNYHGVLAEGFVTNLNPSQKVLFVGSRDDGRTSGNNCGAMAEQLYELATSTKQKIIYDTGGHGTNMFIAHPELLSLVVEFVLE